MSNVRVRRAIEYQENNKRGYRVSTLMNKTQNLWRRFRLVFVGKLLLTRLHIPSMFVRPTEVTDQSSHSFYAYNFVPFKEQNALSLSLLHIARIPRVFLPLSKEEIETNKITLQIIYSKISTNYY